MDQSQKLFQKHVLSFRTLHSNNIYSFSIFAITSIHAEASVDGCSQIYGFQRLQVFQTTCNSLASFCLGLSRFVY
ncbi:hypothetical protein L596_023817 [Steinernema carpocapsae]|uniref:Uncharacterized protein n=1 Tax=Steinernema carpocapsae TaxID=34508 RepID=A0A4U5MET7_STECR|nr:hypothetical protein L596_023817 [Steinernema carpocapsae]